jgi:putative (di)nucleoside polyphosphate hydrolase
MASMHFRAGVVAIVTNSKSQILAFERSDVADQWQLPQGGIEQGETPEEAAWRELGEETSLGTTEVDLIDEFPDWTIYELPNGVGQKGKRLGQAQRWFTFRACSDDVVPTPDGIEFVSWKWVEPEWLIGQIVGFRRASYERVLDAQLPTGARLR